MDFLLGIHMQHLDFFPLVFPYVESTWMLKSEIFSTESQSRMSEYKKQNIRNCVILFQFSFVVFYCVI